MQKLVWQNSNGDVIDLTSGNYGITNWEGFSNADLNIQSQQVPFQDGGVFLDALIEQRELSVTLAMNDGGNLETRYRLRRELIHVLNPKLGEGYLIYTNDFTSKRIKCVPQIPLFETHNSNDIGTPKASLAWTACEPYWEDIEEKTIIINADEINNIENDGDVVCGVDIDLYNIDSENVNITNDTENKKITISGLHNKIININTNAGKKNVIKKEIKADIFFANIALETACYDTRNNEYVFASETFAVVKTKDFKTFEVYKIDYSIEDIYFFPETNLFIATNNGLVIYSTDAINWEEANIAYYLRGVLFVDDKYYGYTINGNDTLVFESEDGADWTSTTVTNIKLKSIVYSEELEKFVGITVNAVYTSTDFVEWTVQRTFIARYELIAICYVKKTNLVIVSDYFDYSTGSERCLLRCFYSSDGETWSGASTGNEQVISQGRSKIAGNRSRGFYIINNKNVFNSITGTSWEMIETKQDNYNKIINFDSFGDFIIFTTNKAETLLTNQANLQAIYEIKDIAYSKKLQRYVMITLTDIYISNDKIIWNKVAEKNNLHQVLYVEEFGKFFLTCYPKVDTYYTSEDGVEWTTQTLAGIYFASEIKYIPKLKKLFIVGWGSTQNGIIAYSSDGINWDFGSTTDVPPTPFISIYSIAYSEAENRLIAVGHEQSGSYRYETYYSDDGGEKWRYKQQTSPLKIEYAKYLKKVFYSSGYTTDGDFWIQTNTLGLEDFCYAEDLAIFIGIKDSECYISCNSQEWQLLNLDLKTEIMFNKIRYIPADNTFYIIGQYSELNDRFTFVELKLQKGENIIAEISSNSDMTLGLEVGKNEIRLKCDEGFVIGKISYRQKYIGV